MLSNDQPDVFNTEFIKRKMFSINESCLRFFLSSCNQAETFELAAESENKLNIKPDGDTLLFNLLSVFTLYEASVML